MQKVGVGERNKVWYEEVFKGTHPDAHIKTRPVEVYG